MATTNANREVFTNAAYGFHVSKAAAALPASAQNIFTITGGRILVTILLGEVTTLCTATATNLKVVSTPTIGTAVDVAANLAIANFEKGALLIVEGDATAIIGTSAGAGFAPALNALPFIIPAGTLSLATSADNAGGATKWDIWYFPLDDGASVASA